MCITEHFCNADGVPQPPERCLELRGVATRKKQGPESLRRPAACYPYAPGFAHGETGTDCRSKLHMHMHIIIVLLRLMVVYPSPQDLLSTRLALMFAVYAPFAGMSTLSLHIYAGTMQF